MADPKTENNGLLPQQEAPFERWLDKEIHDAFIYATGQWEPPPREDKKELTLQDIEAAKANEEARPLYNAVKHIVEESKGDEGLLNRSLKQLKNDKLALAKKGPSKKGFGEILFEGLATLNPIALIMAGIESAMSGGSFFGGLSSALRSAFIAVAKDAAVSYGTDSTAGWMKAFKDNFATWWQGDSWSMDSWGTKTTEQASAELRMGLGAEAVAAATGADAKQVPGLAAAIAAGVEQERKTPSQIPDGGFEYKLPAKPKDPSAKGDDKASQPENSAGAGGETKAPDESEKKEAPAKPATNETTMAFPVAPASELAEPQHGLGGLKIKNATVSVGRIS